LEELFPDIQSSLDVGANATVPKPGDQAKITEKDILVGEKQALTGRIIQLQADSFSRVTSSVVEDAVVPTETVATSSRLFLLAGLLGGFALGIVGAILAARLSSKVLDRY